MKLSKILDSVSVIVDGKGKDTAFLAKSISEFAEPPLREFKSSKLLAGYLRKNGFKVEFPWKHIPTAFRAVYGAKGKRIGILGEYDALPDCGKEQGEWGHGCGHNLFGAGSAVAAVTAAEILKEQEIEGRIIFYGCPAEEILIGKAFMARDGAFRDMDVCLTWHPDNDSRVCPYGGNAVDSVEYEFFGKSAHAAGSAYMGRSALDACILFDIAANYLREHVTEDVRIHSVIMNGGKAPNVVPEYARSWYYVRAKDRRSVDAARKRLDACAEAGAMATDTKLKTTLKSSIYSRLPNMALSEILLREMRYFGSPSLSKSDIENAKKAGLKGKFDTRIYDEFKKRTCASSDEYTVSWLCPLGSFQMATFDSETEFHHPMLARQAVKPFAIKATLQAAKVLAGTAMELLLDGNAFERVKTEFEQKTKKFKFDPLLPRNLKI